MTLKVVASPTIIILTALEVSFMLLANIYSRGVTHDDRHLMIVIYLQYRPLVPVKTGFELTTLGFGVYCSATVLQLLARHSLKLTFLQGWGMDKLKLGGQSQGRVYNSRCGRACIHLEITLLAKTIQLKVENLPLPTFSFSPVSFRTHTHTRPMGPISQNVTL